MRVWAFWRRAVADRRGGIAVTAAIALLPICMLVFAAVEFHNYTNQRTNLQNALDAAALAVARAPSTATQADLRALYITVLKSHLPLKPGVVTLVEASPDPVTGAGGKPELTYVNGRVTANATLAISPIIASFFVSGDLQVSGGSEVMRESKGLEVALVLDTTGSMDTNNRIGIAKTAATNFVTELERATANTATPGGVKVGVVPFAATVNVGSTHQNATWIDATGASPISREIFTTPTGQRLTTGTNRFNLLSAMSMTWGGCVESRPYPHDVRATSPTPTNPETLFVPYFAPDEPDYLPAGEPRFYAVGQDAQNWNTTRGLQLNPVGNSYLWDLKRAVKLSQKAGNNQNLGGDYWGGYRIDFGSTPYYVDKFAAYTGSYYGVLGVPGKYNATELNAELSDPRRLNDGFSRTNTIRGPNQGCDVKPITRLTSNLGAVKTAINGLTAAGDTNIPMGLMWGWHVLAPNAPFSDGAQYTASGTTKVAILMTDGDNRIDGWDYSGVGYAFQNRLGTTSADPAVLGAALDARTTELCSNMRAQGIVIYTMRVEQLTGDPSIMRDCATSPDMFFDVRSASDLDATFKSIARSIQNLRIAA